MPQFVFDVDAGVFKQSKRTGSSVSAPNFDCYDLRNCNVEEYYRISGSGNLNAPGDACSPVAPYLGLSVRDIARYEPIQDSTFVPYTLSTGSQAYRDAQVRLQTYVLQSVISYMDTPANYPLGNPIDFDATNGGSYTFKQGSWTYKTVDVMRSLSIPILKPVLDNCDNVVGMSGKASFTESAFDTFCQPTATRSLVVRISISNKLNIYANALAALNALGGRIFPVTIPDATTCANLPETAFNAWRTLTTLPFTITTTDSPPATP